MELCEEMVLHELREQAIKLVLPNIRLDAVCLVEMRSYKTLEDIRRILDDETLDDPSCFMKIERIVQVYEAMGSDGGCRHDF